MIKIRRIFQYGYLQMKNVSIKLRPTLHLHYSPQPATTTTTTQHKEYIQNCETFLQHLFKKTREPHTNETRDTPDRLFRAVGYVS
jgi:hypothetical protein